MEGLVFYNKLQIGEALILGIVDSEIVVVDSQDELTILQRRDSSDRIFMSFIKDFIVLECNDWSVQINVNHFVRPFSLKSYTISDHKPFKNLLIADNTPRLSAIILNRIRQIECIFCSLHTPLITGILSFLDYQSLQNLFLIDYSWNTYFKNQEIWRELYHYIKGFTGFELERVNWRKLFFTDKSIRSLTLKG